MVSYHREQWKPARVLLPGVGAKSDYFFYQGEQCELEKKLSTMHGPKHTNTLSLFIRAGGGCFVTDWPNVLYANHFDADVLFTQRVLNVLFRVYEFKLSSTRCCCQLWLMHLHDVCVLIGVLFRGNSKQCSLFESSYRQTGCCGTFLVPSSA